MPAVTTPEWVKHAVFYQIFPDRFATSDQVTKPNNLEPWNSEPTVYGYKGGDLRGVIERLDYLQDLGVTALYFNPIFQSASNHRYHTHDYYQVDPLLGGNAAFDDLLAECKRRGLRIVLDGVFNHASRGFFQFNDILENRAASPWLDWFTIDMPADDHPINAYDLTQPPGYNAWVGLHALPKFNTDNPQVREYLMQVGEYWVRKGIDGWRLDVANEIVTPGFWQEFRQRIKAINPGAYIVAEIWEESRQWLQGDQFDAVMNYLWTSATIAFTGGDRVRLNQVADRSYDPWPGINGVQYADKIDWQLGLYDWQIQLVQLNLLDSHDTARFRTIVDNDEASVRLGTLLMFTFPGAPSIYYGDEIGLEGGRPDHMARGTFPWDHPERWNMEEHAFHKNMIALRLAQPALRVGTFHRLHADEHVYAFARTHDSTTLAIAVNVADAPQQVQFRLPNEPAGTHVLWGEPQTIGLHEGMIDITLPARSGIVVDVSGS